MKSKPTVRVQEVLQVEQQDQGYETCGRSENEAERDDGSSPGSRSSRTSGGATAHPLFSHCPPCRSLPEFDDLEMCTSLDCVPQWWPPLPVLAGNSAPQSEPASVIRGLRSRLRCSANPPKVSWSKEEQEEEQQDPGLMELLLSRVEALEEQLRSPTAGRKSVSLDRKSSDWPG